MNNGKNRRAEIYARMGIEGIARILTLQDRNPLSPTFGSFSRTWWLDRTTDFSNALSQYATHALALVWACDMPGNPYYQQPKILSWIFAGMEHWISQQHADGSFDEFYPQERGWAGPTGFLVYAMADSYLRVKDRIPQDLGHRLLAAIAKGGAFLGRYDEIGTLANHYVMAALAIRYAHHVTGDDSLLPGYEKVLNQTLALFDDEGWGLEYDGADIGYLSASVSFFAKIQQIAPDARIAKTIEKAVAFSAYFVYPDGHFAGTLGSRNTLHFYPHGYEVIANENEMAAAVADEMIDGLAAGALVPPGIMADRYFLYRIPEYLLAYIDSREREKYKAVVPCKGREFETWFPKGRFYVAKKGDTYCVINAGKGGVVKIFSVSGKKLIHADSGIMIEQGRKVLSSQWVDPKYDVRAENDEVKISGPMHKLPAKYFTPAKTVLFRLFLIGFGWYTPLAYRLKGWIRQLLMLVHKPDATRFSRTIRFEKDKLTITDEIDPKQGASFRRAYFGDDVPVRYVPQSRYFQSQELLAVGITAGRKTIAALNKGRLRHLRIIETANGKTKTVIYDQTGNRIDE